MTSGMEDNVDPGRKMKMIHCDFSGDPDQYCYETLYFLIFQGGVGSGPLSPYLDQRIGTYLPSEI